MARTKGSGWGGGVLLYQKCPNCGKKKAIYDYGHGGLQTIPFTCTSCKERFHSDTLLRYKYAEQIDYEIITKKN